MAIRKRAIKGKLGKKKSPLGGAKHSAAWKKKGLRPKPLKRRKT